MAKFILTIALYFATLAGALPYDSAASEAYTTNDIATLIAVNNVTANIENIRAALDCKGQSCDIADMSGSTGKLPTRLPEGGSDIDNKCIAKYNPEGVKAAISSKPVTKQATGLSSALLGASHKLGNMMPASDREQKGTFTGKCTPNMIIFAKGTLEPGIFGLLVGPALKAKAPTGWTMVGVSYQATIAGDYCLGLPGGMVARDILNQAAAKCPTSKIFMSGYSQGAMVVHNGIAYADEQAKKRVAAVLVFGDPFQGAKIKGYKGPIYTYCKNGDGVCTGNFEISPSHLSYSGNDVTQAVATMKRIAGVGKKK